MLHGGPLCHWRFLLTVGFRSSNRIVRHRARRNLRLILRKELFLRGLVRRNTGRSRTPGWRGREPRSWATSSTIFSAWRTGIHTARRWALRSERHGCNPRVRSHTRALNSANACGSRYGSELCACSDMHTSGPTQPGLPPFHGRLLPS